MRVWYTYCMANNETPKWYARIAGDDGKRLMEAESVEALESFARAFTLAQTGFDGGGVAIHRASGLRIRCYRNGALVGWHDGNLDAWVNAPGYDPFYGWSSKDAEAMYS